MWGEKNPSESYSIHFKPLRLPKWFLCASMKTSAVPVILSSCFDFLNETFDDLIGLWITNDCRGWEKHKLVEKKMLTNRDDSIRHQPFTPHTVSNRFAFLCLLF